MSTLRDVQTPALVLDRARLDANLETMRRRADALDTPLRPHFKTAKSIDVFARALEPGEGATVSTLAEAEQLFAAGLDDILYAVGIAPGKLERAAALRAQGCDLILTVDSVEAAQAVAAYGATAGAPIPAVIEIDADDHRAGLAPKSADAVAVAKILAQSDGARFSGVMTHAGGSYECETTDAIAAMAERERAAVVETAAHLEAEGVPARIVSVGSTPTLTFAKSLDGVTEARVGVYMFQDLVMAGLGCCSVDDIALSVLVSVIGRQRGRGWVLTDGGWMALSRDKGRAPGAPDFGYGLVCDADGAPLAGHAVISANQEHGIIARIDGGEIDFDAFEIGAQLRILPNHACATAAQHAHYHVVENGQDVIAEWPRENHW